MGYRVSLCYWFMVLHDPKRYRGTTIKFGFFVPPPPLKKTPSKNPLIFFTSRVILYNPRTRRTSANTRGILVPSNYYPRTFQLLPSYLPIITLVPSNYYPRTFQLLPSYLPIITLILSNYYPRTFQLLPLYLPSYLLIITLVSSNYYPRTFQFLPS